MVKNSVSSLANSILDRFIELSLWEEMTAWEAVSSSIILFGKIVLSASSGRHQQLVACEDGKYMPLVNLCL